MPTDPGVDYFEIVRQVQDLARACQMHPDMDLAWLAWVTEMHRLTTILKAGTNDHTASRPDSGR